MASALLELEPWNPVVEVPSIMRVKRKHAILLALIAAIIGGAVFHTLDPPSLDFSKDEEPFRSMAMPLKSVTGMSIFNDGTLSFQIVDNTGKEIFLQLPIDNDALRNAYPSVSYRIQRGTKLVPLKDPERAKSIVIQLLNSHPTRWKRRQGMETNEHYRRKLEGIPPDMMGRIERSTIQFLSEL
ncbi:MAG: hypothetical protein EOP88_22690 [Verrucomicrobiaceae bacterium]|nr:MAG: hypothetical protein EOP88_22690 [Verrucomicrobiaceae bacterium]